MFFKNIYCWSNITNIIPPSSDDGSLEPKLYRVDLVSQWISPFAWITFLSMFLSLSLSIYIYIYIYKDIYIMLKLTDHSWEWPKGSLFNIYNTGLFHLPLIHILSCEEVSSNIFSSLWYVSTWKWTSFSRTIETINNRNGIIVYLTLKHTHMYL